MKDKYEIGVVSDEGKPEPVEPVFEARTDFYPVLKKRVENFLAREKINPRDSPAFYLKALIVMSCYALSLILCTFVFPGNYWYLFVLSSMTCF